MFDDPKDKRHRMRSVTKMSIALVTVQGSAQPIVTVRVLVMMIAMLIGLNVADLGAAFAQNSPMINAPPIDTELGAARRSSDRSIDPRSIASRSAIHRV